MRAFLLFIALTVLSALPAWSADVLIVQSARGAAYDDALRGFHATCGASWDAVVLSDYADVNVSRLVREERPRLVVAVGDNALAATRNVREVPVVGVLAFSLNVQREPAGNVGGVAMLAAPEQYLKLFSAMGMKRIGILYDRSKTGYYVKRVARESKQLGITLVTEPLSDPHDVQVKLEKIKDRVDALWLLPDSTVATALNVEAFMLFSVSNRVPVVAFSSEYLKYGAAAALATNFYMMGQQAGELAGSILNGGASPSVRDPSPARVYTNEPVMRKLGLKGTKFSRLDATR